jgi:hypothetical protein
VILAQFLNEFLLKFDYKRKIRRRAQFALGIRMKLLITENVDNTRLSTFCVLPNSPHSSSSSGFVPKNRRRVLVVSSTHAFDRARSLSDFDLQALVHGSVSSRSDRFWCRCRSHLDSWSVRRDRRTNFTSRCRNRLTHCKSCLRRCNPRICSYRPESSCHLRCLPQRYRCWNLDLISGMLCFQRPEIGHRPRQPWPPRPI